MALRRGAIRVGASTSLREAAKEWLSGAREGVVRNRSGDQYKPSALRGYEQALRDYIIPELGATQLADVRRSDVQRLVDRLLGSGLNASTIRNALLPLRAIYRHALSLDEVAVNPAQGIRLPAVRGRRDRVASPDEAAELLAALEPRDRALLATAMYAGLRMGELRALRWDDVDLAAGLIRVERAWDKKEGMIEPKSRAGRRACRSRLFCAIT